MNYGDLSFTNCTLSVLVEFSLHVYDQYSSVCVHVSAKKALNHGLLRFSLRVEETSSDLSFASRPIH
jgi:hypothetical protein